MTDSNDRDFIGEVIAEDNANMRKPLTRLGEMKLIAESSERGRLQADSENRKLRQQVVDVSSERDNLRQLSVTSILLDVVPGEDGMGHEIYAGSVSAVQLIMDTQEDEIEALQLRLNASEARNAEAGKLLSRRNDSVRLGEDFDLPMSLMIEIDDFLAQSAPATKPNLVECDACPTSSGCVNTCMKAPATDEQGAGS